MKMVMVMVDINLWMFSGMEAHYIHFLEACQLDIFVEYPTIRT
jgi:hypothetical protein